MILNPKKIIGTLGRRYGGKPFQIVRKVIYDSILLPSQMKEWLDIRRKSPRKDSSIGRFFSKYYSCSRTGKKKIATGIICMVDGKMYHGGLTDRIRGILTTYREARQRRIPFHIFWNSPFSLEDFLIPAETDWRISDDEISFSRDESFPVIIEESTTWQAHLDNAMRLKSALGNNSVQWHVYSNADNAFEDYPVLYKELFQPSPALERELLRHRPFLGEKYYSFSFRFLTLLGDFDELNSNVLPDDEAQQLMKRVADELSVLIKDVPADYKILITADSLRFLSFIAHLDKRIYIVPGDIKHVDVSKGDFDEAWMKTFVDQHLIMGAEKVFLLRTGGMYRSGFAKFAAKIGGKPFVDHHFQ